ncbi:MAG: hypothetical protein JXQ90_21480 [Cyclobacteriaceae bacterium]
MFRSLVEALRFIVCLILPLKFTWIMVRHKSRRSKLIVSFTTTPKRISSIGPTINSILLGASLPESIILNIPEKFRKQEVYNIPKFLNHVDLIQINYIEKDLGPGTKLIPTAKRFANDDINIVIIDDDQVYPRHLISNFIQQSSKHPEAALGYAGWRVPKSNRHRDKHFLKAGGTRFLAKKNINSPQQVDVLQGSSSYLVKPSHFSEELWDEVRKPEFAYFADDIWINGLLAKNGVERLVIPTNDKHIRLHSFNKIKGALHLNENLDNHNNDRLYEHFKGYWTY